MSNNALEKALSKGVATFTEEMPTALANIDSGAGLEQVSREDRKTPRVAVAQKMSPEVDEDNEKHIEGLKPGDMFNNVTGKIIGRGPLYVTPVKIFPDQIFFKEEGGIACRAYVTNPDAVKRGAAPILAGELNPSGCRSCEHNQFRGGTPPECDKIWNFLCFLHNVEGDLFERLAVVSLKSVGLATAEKWFELIDKRKVDGKKKPIYTHVYKLLVELDKRPRGDSYQLKVDNAGWVSAEMAPGLEEMFVQFAGQDVEVDGHGDGDDDVRF